jgi:hypothetical protein
MKIEYSSNNSGGSWWLSDKDWEKLRKAGWEVQDYVHVCREVERKIAEGDSEVLRFDPRRWYSQDAKGVYRYLGAIATKATKNFETPAEAMREFEKITGQSVMDEGCNCCGAPHSFRWGRAIDDSLPKTAEYGRASGEECREYLFDESAPANLRDALEEIERLKGKRK